MLEWHDYITQLLSHESSFDDISLSLDNSQGTVGVPPIIKASVLMLDRMLDHQGKFNIMVFPERIQSIFIFTLVKLLHNISEGRIKRTYNPEKFVSGDKLRFGKFVVEFVGIEEHFGKNNMRLRFTDLEEIAPIDFFPLFQKTTATKVSQYKDFGLKLKEAKESLAQLSLDEQYLKLLEDYKTHMDSSIINMTSIINTKELISGCQLCGRSVKDAILVGQADYEGNVKNIGVGQLEGIPAIVLASDLYAISAMAERRHPIQSIIIDASNANALLSQMDALDELMRLGVPITCVTDVVNSFDLQPFFDRQFNLWRWDENSITEKLYDANPLTSDRKIKHCANRTVNYLVTDGNEISAAIKKLATHRSEAQTLSAQMLKLFDSLCSLAFTALRETINFDDGQRSQAKIMLDGCSGLLAGEKDYLAPAVYDDYKTIIVCLKKVFSEDFILPKYDSLANQLAENNYKSVCIIVPERSEKQHVQVYWQQWCHRSGLNTQVNVLYPAEYYTVQCTQFSVTIVVGWLKRAIMRKILYSFNTQIYTVLLYDYESRWQRHDVDKWSAALDSSQNRRTIEKSFNTDKLQVSTSRFVPSEPATVEAPGTDEYAEIETVLLENKYRRYVASCGHKSVNEVVEAIPVNYVGGYLAFYRTGHKVISASNIILNDADKIDTVLPEQLKMGDFVVVRESDRDLIKEMADINLEHSGQGGLRDVATKWKEALEIETLFNTDEEIYRRLQNAGCTRGYQTVRSWLHDEDYIAPQSKQDLELIATITGSEVLKDLLNQIFEAAQIVRSAHVQAGRVLSMQLRSRIVEELDKYGNIDPFNIWEPIGMQVEGIGTVRILKIIDIGAPVVVDMTNTNRLIDEE